MTDLQWIEIDLDSLPHDVRDAYDEYKVVQREAAKLRATFEAALTAASPAPACFRYAFGYRFGKLSIALAPAAPAKPRTAPVTMAQLAVLKPL